MPRPAKLPEWASSGVNVLEPGAGKKAAGWLASEQPPASFFNWLFGTLYQWVQWLAGTREAQELSALLNIVSTTIGAANQMNAFALNDSGVLVAVGVTGKIYTSTNFGTTWTARTAAASYTGAFADVIWTGTAFVAVGVSGEIQTSPDGTTWTHRNSLVADALQSLVRNSAGVIVAVGGGTGKVTRSTDDGATWVVQPSLNGGTFFPGRIVESGGIFICVGNATGANPAISIWRSSNGGINFQAVDITGVIAPTTLVFDVIAVPGGGGFVAQATTTGNTTQVLVGSADGLSWSAAYTTPTAYNLFLCAGAGVVALVPQYSTINGFGYVSGDRGTTWRQQYFRPLLVDTAGVKFVEGGNTRLFALAGKSADAGKVAVSPLWAAF